jgi:riboflavin kinase/FMN adenylyltransferase
MITINGMGNIPQILRGAFVTIGNFDGVHLGHQFIFKKLAQEANKAKKKSVVITFDPNPKMVLHPDRRPFYLISTLEEKISLLASLNIDAVIIIPFSLEYSQTSAESFVREVLWNKLHIKKIFVGHDYTFGKGKEGNEKFLSTFGKKLGFDVEVIEAVKINHTIASSTRIRNAILEGDVKTAAILLGRHFNLSGTVIQGHHRGENMGIHTANIQPEKVLVPASGVYAVIVVFNKKRYQGMLNIGFNPTFEDKKLSIEVHILNFKQDIYGKRLDILFIERLRDETKFDSVEKLIDQIKHDIESGQKILKPYFQPNQKSF